jgi:hypothetical protein
VLDSNIKNIFLFKEINFLYLNLRFYLEAIFYAIYYILIFITIFLKRTYYDHLITNNCTLSESEPSSSEHITEHNTEHNTEHDTELSNETTTHIAEHVIKNLIDRSSAHSSESSVTYYPNQSLESCKCAYLYPSDSLRYVILNLMLA